MKLNKKGISTDLLFWTIAFVIFLVIGIMIAMKFNPSKLFGW
jgi:hypothetical protein